MSLDKMFDEVRQVTVWLKEHETKADNLLNRVSSIQTRLEAMKQYRFLVDSLNKLAHHTPRYEIVGVIAEEQRRINLLKHEQTDLRTLVDEQQEAIQHIVCKLREQLATLSELRRRDVEAFQLLKYKQKQEANKCANKLHEVSAVVARASALHERGDADDCMGRINVLERENARLRDILRLRNLPSATDVDDESLTDADVAPAFATLDVHVQTESASVLASATESGGEFDMRTPFFVDSPKQSPCNDEDAETENDLGVEKEEKRDSGCDSDE